MLFLSDLHPAKSESEYPTKEQSLPLENHSVGTSLVHNISLVLMITIIRNFVMEILMLIFLLIY